MYMKSVYVSDKNAKMFDKQVDENVVFAKYFSPSCPACIAMESEWDDMCKDIDKKYNTKLLVAQIDPSGMKELENTHTYNDVDYVPHIVILEKGKKISEYNGPKTKEDMIRFLLEGGYLTSKMNGGGIKSRRMKHTTKKRKTTNKLGRKTRRSVRRGTKFCVGKRDGKSGCRKCCKSKKHIRRCITKCMQRV